MAHHAIYFPPEIRDNIFGYATDDGRDARSLASCALVNKDWNSKARPLLYSRWIYHGEKHSYKSLWKFLRTVIRDDSIAALVQTVDARNWSQKAAHSAQSSFEIPYNELRLVREAVRTFVLRATTEILINGIKNGDRKPLMALLLTILPNLRTLSAHVPDHDLYLFAMSCSASLESYTGRIAMLPYEKLQDLSLLSQGPLRRISTSHKFDLKWYSTVFSFPQLRCLSLLDV